MSVLKKINEFFESSEKRLVYKRLIINYLFFIVIFSVILAIIKYLPKKKIIEKIISPVIQKNLSPVVQKVSPVKKIETVYKIGNSKNLRMSSFLDSFR